MEKILLFPKKLIHIRGRMAIRAFVSRVVSSLIFITLLIIYLLAKAYKELRKFRWFPGIISNKFSPTFRKFYNLAILKMDTEEEYSIKRISLIELALRNMKYKKSRTLITIGGMAVGIATIVFLVSIGYGAQQLVVNRVARLEELKQADVSPLAGGNLQINDKSLASFKELKNVAMVLPLITVVGRVNFHNSVSDMAVYGVTADYLEQSAIKPSHGSIFTSNNLATVLELAQDVKGAETQPLEGKIGEKKGEIIYSINSGEWIRVRAGPTQASSIIGYTKQTALSSQGNEVYGGSYEADGNTGNVGVDYKGNTLGLWINDNVLLWQAKTCDSKEGDCEDGKYQVLRDENGKQLQKEGYFAEVNIVSHPENTGQVLGAATESAQIAQVGTISVDQLSSQSALTNANLNTPKLVQLSASARKEAVVNLAMLKILGIKESQAVGQTFNVTFVGTGDSLSGGKNIESSPAEYKIVGVISDNSTPIFYVPFIDLRSLGISNYSQVKLVVDNKDSLTNVRRQISGLGFTSSSVADTVSQINSLFSTITTVLGLLGTLALVVAALGMFNTLTVSLLERTREVGLMKAMGMKSEEVKELFLTESMIMGFFGGVLGIILGFIAGKILSFILSIFAISKGLGIIDVTYIPFSLILLILSLSFLVGLITGIYPARRATKISALNALRYE